MISKVTDKVNKFLKETVKAHAIRIIGIDKVENGWVAEAEVSARNQYLTTINPEYRVFEKERYIIKLDSDLEVSSYKRVKSEKEEKESPDEG